MNYRLRPLVINLNITKAEKENIKQAASKFYASNMSKMIRDILFKNKEDTKIEESEKIYLIYQISKVKNNVRQVNSYLIEDEKIKLEKLINEIEELLYGKN